MWNQCFLVDLFFCCMSMNFVIDNISKTCIYVHCRVEVFIKICAYEFFQPRACINVYVNFSLITYGKHIEVKNAINH